MPDRIHLLPDSVANQIAAGEVIQRPSSVIKELVENAVDAGADDIKIIVKDAGRTLIQVIDNGHGMSATDARMAFERHATSKIATAADLASLKTMGFRGEALPSICAISQVELRSRQEGDSMGTHLLISGSRVEQQEPDVCEKGTNIMVKNLFFNVPARRKFMKSDNVELSNIMREFERLALVNPGVKMSIDTGGKVLDVRKGTMLRRIGEIWKGSLVEQLIPVDVDTPTVKISGYVTRPEFARRRNALQYFYVNGRHMRHPYFRKAVLNCFNGLIASDTQPCYFINFEIDPSAIDVNIHPTKDEIKFEEEAVIWSVLTAAVKGSLGKNAAVPSIDFDSEALPVTPIDQSKSTDLPGYNISTEYNPFASAAVSNIKKGEYFQYPSDRGGSRGTKVTGWEKLYEDFMGSSSKPEIERPRERTVIGPEQSLYRNIDETLQFDSKYIVASLEEVGVLIVDQHRAHVKIIYEDLIKRIEEGIPVSQTLVFPEVLELSPEQTIILEDAYPILLQLGMIISKEGNHYVITGTPPGVTAQEANDIVVRILEALSDDASHYGEESVEEVSSAKKRTVVLSMARSMAVKKGRILTSEERRNLITELFSLSEPAFTPTGRRIYRILNSGDIEKLLP